LGGFGQVWANARLVVVEFSRKTTRPRRADRGDEGPLYMPEALHEKISWRAARLWKMPLAGQNRGKKISVERISVFRVMRDRDTGWQQYVFVGVCEKA
jgi:hypothetical protein